MGANIGSRNGRSDKARRCSSDYRGWNNGAVELCDSRRTQGRLLAVRAGRRKRQVALLALFPAGKSCGGANSRGTGMKTPAELIEDLKSALDPMEDDCAAVFDYSSL